MGLLSSLFSSLPQHQQGQQQQQEKLNLPQADDQDEASSTKSLQIINNNDDDFLDPTITGFLPDSFPTTQPSSSEFPLISPHIITPQTSKTTMSNSSLPESPGLAQDQQHTATPTFNNHQTQSPFHNDLPSKPVTPLNSIENIAPASVPKKQRFFQKLLKKQPTQQWQQQHPQTQLLPTANISHSTTFFSQNDTDDDDEDRQKERDEGCKAGVFGFVPNFPTPPKYIWVRSHRKKAREFNRLFLAQQLDCKTLASNTATSTSGKMGKPTIWCAKFSLDGKYLATAGTDNIVRVWQVISTPEEREMYNFYQNTVATPDTPPADDLVSLHSKKSANGTSMHSSNSNYNISNNNNNNSHVSAPVFLPFPVREYHGHKDEILDLSWSKNNFLLSSSKDRTVHLWHVKVSNSIQSFVHNDYVTSVTFHPTDDRFFLSGCLDCGLRLWSIPEKKTCYVARAPDLIMATAFTPDGNTAIAGCFGGQCLFYETEGLNLRSQMLVKSSHGKNAKGSKITGIEAISSEKFRNPEAPTTDASPKASTINSGQDYRLLVSTNDSRIRLYNLKDRTLITKFKGHENQEGLIHASFSDTGLYIISGSEDDRTYIWRVNSTKGADSAKTREDYEYFHSHNSAVTVALFAPHATRRLVYESRDPIYDLADPPQVILTTAPPGAGPVGSSNNSSSSYKVKPLDGNIIISTDEDGVIKVFRQDSAYRRRKQLLETASVQKKKLALAHPCTLSPRPSTSRSGSVMTPRQDAGAVSPMALARQEAFQQFNSLSLASNRGSPSSSINSATAVGTQLPPTTPGRIPTLDLNEEGGTVRCSNCGSNDFKARTPRAGVISLVCTK
jgi:WD40 repeat protein